MITADYFPSISITSIALNEWTRIAENEEIFTHADFKVAEQRIKKLANLQDQSRSYLERIFLFVADVEEADSSILVDPALKICIFDAEDALNEAEIQPIMQIVTPETAGGRK